jgi:putative nucleotidyltransferase-like protein/coenzyme PQQ synthesis protein D (PqqD)
MPRQVRRRTREPGLITVLRAACLDESDVSMAVLPDGVVRWAVETGLGPLVGRAVAHDPEAAAAPLWPLVQGASLTARFLTAQLVTGMTDIVDAGRGAMPPPVLLKGISMCDQHYPEPHLRPMRDIDFLVEEDALPAAEAVLRRLGYRQSSARPAAFYQGHHHSSPFVHPATGVWVDVHRALFPAARPVGSNGALGPEHLERQLRWSEFQGRPVRRLSHELQIVHLACHWARGLRAVGGMVAMADIACLLRNAPAVDWERILDWTDAAPASRYLCLLLTYLDRHRLIDLAPGILQRLDAMPTSPGHLTLRIAHSLLDRYVVDGQDFGMLMSERNFNRLWKLLVLQSRPSAGRGLRPWTVLREPRRRSRRLAERGRSGDVAGGEVGIKGVMSMRRSEVEAAPGATQETDGASAGLYPKRRSGLRVRAVDGDMVILDRQRQLVHQINQTARFIWDRCDGQHTTLHIARELAQAFDVDPLSAQKDVATAVRRLESVGLVETRRGQGPTEGHTRRAS